MLKLRTIACSSLAAFFIFIAVGTAGACPLVTYQPELPRRD